jgi:hypothetical protein
LTNIALLREGKRKLVIYDVSLDGKLEWDIIKKRRLNVFAGTGPALSPDRLQATCRQHSL